MKRRVGFICLFLVLLALLINLFYIFKLDDKINDSKVFNFVTSITAIIGVIGLIFQQSRGQELNSAQYLTNLSHEYYKENDFQKLLDKMEEGKDLAETDLVIACNCLDFFEPFYLLQKANTFAMKQMDDLFCFRFFALVNNKQVQELELLKHCEYYANIAKLYKKWRKYRLCRNRPIPFVENDLSNHAWFKNLCDGKPVQEKVVRRTNHLLKNVGVPRSADNQRDKSNHHQGKTERYNKKRAKK